jgi:hypothetical protein
MQSYMLHEGFLSKYLFLFCLTIVLPRVLLSQIIDPPKQGKERIVRQDNNWEWGTCGHGSFEDAVRLFSADKEVMTYTEGKIVYRVFSMGNKNYVEMNRGWSGGIFVYTTNSTTVNKANESPENNTTKELLATDTLLNKVIRKEGNWAWGTYDHGNFDQAAFILKEEPNIIRFIDPNNKKIKYRVFTHTTLNFVEIDYGWEDGIFEYTTNR